jgi:hypothetical protein
MNEKFLTEVQAAWEEFRRPTIDQLDSLIESLEEMKRVFEKQSPSIHDLRSLQEAYYGIELPLIDNYPLIAANPFIEEWLNKSEVS